PADEATRHDRENHPDQPDERDVGVEILGDPGADPAKFSMCRKPDQTTARRQVVHERTLLPVILLLPGARPERLLADASVELPGPPAREAGHGAQGILVSQQLHAILTVAIRFEGSSRRPAWW